MTLGQFLSILKARWWMVLSTLGACLAIAIAAIFLLNKEYTATTTVVVDYKGVDPVLGVTLPVQMMPGYLATQIDIISSHKVAVETVKRLRLGQNAVVRQQWLEATEGKGNVDDWFADILLQKLDVRPSKESSVVAISFSGRDPQFAAIIANAFAEAYQKTNLELRVEPAKISAQWFDDRLQQLRKQLEQAQTRLNEYQREKGFTAQDERLDLESSRLQELSAQYTMAQAQAADASSRERQVREFMARGASVETLPDVLANPLIQNLKSQLTMTEGRLQQIASQLGSNHPEVRRLEADIQSQKAKIKTELAAAASSISNSAKIAARREADLRAALGEQKAKLLKGNEGRDQMQVLMKEVESAQRAYDSAAARFQQTNLEGQASQTNISILTPAVAPLEPSFPRPILMILAALFGGTILGVIIALIAEIRNRRIRSIDDLIASTGVPVLGRLPARAGSSGRRMWRKGRGNGTISPQATLATKGA